MCGLFSAGWQLSRVMWKRRKTVLEVTRSFRLGRPRVTLVPPEIFVAPFGMCCKELESNSGTIQSPFVQGISRFNIVWSAPLLVYVFFPDENALGSMFLALPRVRLGISAPHSRSLARRFSCLQNIFGRVTSSVVAPIISVNILSLSCRLQ